METKTPQTVTGMCGALRCYEDATHRVTLPCNLPEMDVCGGCFEALVTTVAGAKMADRQCPGCLGVAPAPWAKGQDPQTQLYTCGRCGGIYGTMGGDAKLEMVTEPQFCQCGRPQPDSRYFDLTWVDAAGKPVKRLHGWSCRGCGSVQQWG